MTSLQRLIRQAAADHGFQLVRDHRHLVWRHPNGAQVVTARTPSDHRALSNARSTFRRAAAA